MVKEQTGPPLPAVYIRFSSMQFTPFVSQRFNPYSQQGGKSLGFVYQEATLCADVNGCKVLRRPRAITRKLIFFGDANTNQLAEGDAEKSE